MNNHKSHKSLIRYAALTTQYPAGIGISVFFGLKIDKWLEFSTPIAVWVLPLLLISGVIIKIAIETSGKNQSH